MAWSTWVLGLSPALSARRALGVLLGAALYSTASCGLPAQGQSSGPSPVDPNAGTGGDSVVGTGGQSTEPTCVPQTTQTPVFAAQAIAKPALFKRELYAWTTDTQGLALRADRTLFAEPAGTDAPFDLLTAQQSPSAAELQLGLALSRTFQMGRYAWPEPWATRMGLPGKDPGGQLIRILLQPEAWVAVVEAGSLSVFNAQQQAVSLADAAQHPERIGVIYFDSAMGNPNGCDIGASGYREFLVGNLAMVQEWSLGTQQARDKLQANIDELTQFLYNIRTCPVTTDSTTWSQKVVCSWGGSLADSSASGGAAGDSGSGGFGAAGFSGTGMGFPVGPSVGNDGTEEYAYDQALSVPSANYLPAPAQIAAIIETLEGDLFEPDPLVVTPGSP